MCFVNCKNICRSTLTFMGHVLINRLIYKSAIHPHFILNHVLLQWWWHALWTHAMEECVSSLIMWCPEIVLLASEEISVKWVWSYDRWWGNFNSCMSASFMCYIIICDMIKGMRPKIKSILFGISKHIKYNKDT